MIYKFNEQIIKNVNVAGNSIIGNLKNGVFIGLNEQAKDFSNQLMTGIDAQQISSDVV